MTGRFRAAVAAGLVAGLLPLPAAGQATQPAEALLQPQQQQQAPAEFESWSLAEELTSIEEAAVRLPVAALLGAALAFRPKRRGTPPRSAAVVQTQIILAVVGAMVMLVVGASLARAFGIVGAASLIRYRAKVSDPKDAGVMLSTLALGLAAGVGLYGTAVVATIFTLGVLWALESFEPETQKLFEVTVKRDGILDRRQGVESVLRRLTRGYELRSSATDELVYEVRLPLERRPDRVSNAILNLDEQGKIAVQWQERKSK